MTGRGTSYTSEIETPSGLTFHASIYVPPDAEYADQHELAEVAAFGATKMLVDVDRAEDARREAIDLAGALEAAKEALTCGEPLYDDGPRCIRRLGHPELHHAATGHQWEIIPDPFLNRDGQAAEPPVF